MASAGDIQIVSMPNLEKIENFFKDSSYRETIEISANFNTRLCLERRLRLPFFDPQTRIAQNHSQLFIDKRQRMPGFRQGQLYTYPAPRWRKSRRQYLNKMYKFPERPFQRFRKEQDHSLGLASSSSGFTAITGTASPTVGPSNDPEFNGAFLEESSSLGAGGGDTSDSKDSQQLQTTQTLIKDDMVKEWFYDMDINDVDTLEDPKSPADDEYDYDPRYGSKKRKKRRPGKKSSFTPGEGNFNIGTGGPGRRKSGVGRGRGSNTGVSTSTVTTPLNTSLTSEPGDGSLSGDVSTTPTSSLAGRKPRGNSNRGRRRYKKGEGSSHDEPPSFESAAAAVGVVNSDIAIGEDHSDLRTYRKYL